MREEGPTPIGPTLLLQKKEVVMTRKRTVEFDAHKTVKKPTEVSFRTKTGKEVNFTADKPTKVPVHVRFKARDTDN